jgi:hypothetical protein
MNSSNVSCDAHLCEIENRSAVIDETSGFHQQEPVFLEHCSAKTAENVEPGVENIPKAPDCMCVFCLAYTIQKHGAIKW